MTKGRAAIIALARAMVDRIGNLAPKRPLPDGSFKIVARGVKEDG